MSASEWAAVYYGGVIIQLLYIACKWVISVCKGRSLSKEIREFSEAQRVPQSVMYVLLLLSALFWPMLLARMTLIALGITKKP